MDTAATDPTHPDYDPGPAAQAAAEAHLEKVWTAFYEAEDGDTDEPQSPESAPFCGCDTCITRETIAGAWPVIEAYFVARGARPLGEGLS